MKSTTLLPLLFLSTTASAALLHRAIPQDPSFPARIRRSTQEAHIARSPSPQGPPSNPGEFIDPGLSRANPRNNPPPPLSSATYAASGPSAANYEYASVSLPVATSVISAAAASSPTPDMSNMSNMDMNTTAPDTTMNMNDMMNSTDPNIDNTTIPDMPDPTDPNIDNTTTSSSSSTMDPGMGMGTDNSTSASPPYPSNHHHHHNHTHTQNATLYYNSTDSTTYIDTIYPNGTETIQETTDSPYPYENGTRHHHHHHHGNRTQDYGAPTPTGYAVLPGQTGRGPERLGAAGGMGGGPGVGVGFKPGFTGPKVRRERVGRGRGRRWLSGVW